MGGRSRPGGSTYAAAGCFALLVFAYLWPALVGGKILSPNAALYAYVPWKQYTPNDILDYYNSLLTDVPLADYPWRAFARTAIHAGTVPLWDPHALAGVPFFSNPQTGIFSPFSLPLWILPLNYGIGVGAALKLWAGGFGTYLLVRQLRLGFLPGLLAGTSYAFCSLNIVWLTHETLPAVAVMLPWMVWLIERIFERSRPGSALALAVVTAFALGGGHPGMQLHVLLAAGLYLLLRAAFTSGVTPAARAQRLAIAAGGLALGVLLMALMLVPEALSSRGTLGTLARHGSEGALPGQQMPADAIKTALFPDWWGRAGAISATEPPGGASTAQAVNYNERTFYAGIVALLLACVGLAAARERWRSKAPFALLGVIGLAIPLRAPGLHQLVEQLPGLDVVQNQRLHFVFEFAVAVLAAFGLHAVLERPAGDRGRLAVMCGGIAVGLIAFVAIGPSSADVDHLVHHFLTGTDYQLNSVLALTSVAWWLLLAAGVALALLAARRWPQRRALVGIVVVLLAAGDMLHFAHGYQPIAPAARAIPPTPPSVAYLQRHAHAGVSRIAGLGYTIPNAWSGLQGLDDVRGYDPPYPTVRFSRLWALANPQQAESATLVFEQLTSDALKVTGMLGARYILAAPATRAPRRGIASRVLTRVYNGPDATIFTNAWAVQRAVVPAAVRLTANAEEVREEVVTPEFDPRRAVLVERDQPGAEALDAGPAAARGTVAVVHEQNARVTLRASLTRGGLVVLNDSFTDGWTVRVDGRAAPALHVNDVMRGVVVGTGRHQIVWSYAVPGLRVGLVLSLLALIVLLVGAAVLGVRKRTRWPASR